MFSTLRKVSTIFLKLHEGLLQETFVYTNIVFLLESVVTKIAYCGLQRLGTFYRLHFCKVLRKYFLVYLSVQKKAVAVQL